MKIQKGCIQVKMSEYYTATVRDINALERMLNDESELKDKLEILSVHNVSKEFEAAVRKMIEDFLKPNDIEEVECYKYRRDGTIKRETIFTLKFKGNKVMPLEDTCEMYEPRFQKIKESGFGKYFNFCGERWYFD